uniref:cilia- and flagella-associated protein 157 isoform X2 n=1 Tax=Scatophagus argus TaxID=75038 RepID=UPI001ED81DA9|nr:cilia- and flagella-associated protein 157 isoform X2 [Scatophagus argus]
MMTVSFLNVGHLEWSLKAAARLKLEYAKLEKENKDLTSQHSMLKKDKKDSTERLKLVLADKKKVEELESQLWAIREDKEALELQHSQQKQKLQEQVDELNSVNMMQVAQCEEQKEQLKQMMQQLSDKESLEKQLVSQKEEHEAAMCRLKMEEELERKRLTEQILGTVDDCVKMKTSVILPEVRILQKSLLQTQFPLTESMALEREVGALQDEVNDLCIKRNTLKKDVSKSTHENLTCKKELEQMKQRCQHLEMNLNDYRAKNKNQLDKERDLRQDMASVSEKCRQQTAETSQLAAELQKKNSRCQELEGVMQESIIILKHALSEKESDTQWMMDRLHDIMESTVQCDVSTVGVSKEWWKTETADH